MIFILKMEKIMTYRGFSTYALGFTLCIYLILSSGGCLGRNVNQQSELSITTDTLQVAEGYEPFRPDNHTSIVSSKICDEKADQALMQGDYDTSVLLHLQLLDKHPDNKLALYHLGYAYGNKHDHEMEVFYYEKAVSLGFSQNGIFFNTGMAYWELKQFDESIRAFQRALDVDSENIEARYGLSVDYMEIGELQMATEQLRKILEIDPNHKDALDFLNRIEKN